MRRIFILFALCLTIPMIGGATPVPKNDFDEGLFEDVLPQAKSPQAKPGERMVSIDIDITVDYVFFNPNKDAFKVKYLITLGGAMAQDLGVIRGTAKVKTDISGYLAKWTTGQCLLQVSIADVPFDIQYSHDSKTVRLNLKFERMFTEDWQSMCTFLDAPDSRFYTKGEPERWIAGALLKSEPALDKLSAPLSEREKTTATIRIAKHSMKDESIGGAEIQGTGKITVLPPPAPPPEKK